MGIYLYGVIRWLGLGHGRGRGHHVRLSLVLYRLLRPLSIAQNGEGEKRRKGLLSCVGDVTNPPVPSSALIAVLRLTLLLSAALLAPFLPFSLLVHTSVCTVRE